MATKIITTRPSERLIRDTSPTLSRIDPQLIARALGAEAVELRFEEALAPITLFAVRAELLGRLHSTGTQTALSNHPQQAKIPLGEQDWADLERLAASISLDGVPASAGEVARVLLSLSIRSVIAQIEKSPA